MTHRQTESFIWSEIYIYLWFFGFFSIQTDLFSNRFIVINTRILINKIEIDFKFPSLSKSYIKLVFFCECFMLHVTSVIQIFFLLNYTSVPYVPYIQIKIIFITNFSIMKSIYACCLIYLSLCLEIFLNYYGNTMEFYFLFIPRKAIDF